MEDQDRPNLFQYATSELSQDAFICWLAAWADPKFARQKSGLSKMGQDFIQSMLEKNGDQPRVASIDRLKISRQYPVGQTLKKKGKIDVLIDLTYMSATGQTNKVLIVIEDKIDAALTEQLKLYESAIRNHSDYGTHDKHFILFKTGYYDTLSEVNPFKKYGRDDLIKVLRPYTERSEIVADFSSNLKEIDSRLNAFERNPVPEKFLPEKDSTLEEIFFLTGFHRWLLRQNNLRLSNAGYGYVHNPSGGFNGFWWDFSDHLADNYWSYLQWENENLCFKIGFPPNVYAVEGWKSRADEIRALWSKTLLNLDTDLVRGIKSGKTMTVAKVRPDNALCKKVDGTLDLARTVSKMVKAQEVLKQARKLIASTVK